jgi:hypothetical protein
MSEYKDKTDHELNMLLAKRPTPEVRRTIITELQSRGCVPMKLGPGAYWMNPVMQPSELKLYWSEDE